MKKEKFIKFIFNPKHENLSRTILGLSLSFLGSLVFYFSQGKESTVPPALEPNLNIMIPPGHILYPFEATNYERIEPLLEGYNMVRVYNALNGEVLARNIKVIRAPKAPENLAFLLPVNIANHFSKFGLHFKVVLQEYNTDLAPALENTPKILNKKKPLLTYGGKKNGQ